VVTIRRARTAAEEPKSYDFFYDDYIAAARGSKALHVRNPPPQREKGGEREGERERCV